MTPKLAKGAFAFFAAYAAFFASDNLTAPRWSDWRKLEMEGRQVQGRVQEVTPKDHDGCRFSYRVDGREYWSRASGCGKSSIGDEITLTYLPSNPEINTTRSPRSMWLEPMITVCVFSLICAIGATRGSERIRKLISQRPT